MKKIDKDVIVEEMKRIFAINNRMPKIKEWRQLSPKFSIDVLIREFSNWIDAWKAIGVEEDTPANKKRAEIIDDLKISFNSFSDRPIISDVIRLSGHTMATIMKYFGSVDNALKIAKIDISKKLSNEELLAAFKEVYDKVGRMPTTKEIKENCKYSFMTLIRRFESIENIANNLNLPSEELKTRVTEQDMVSDLSEIYKKVNKTPTLSDVKKFGKYSPDSYRRMFGKFSNALAKIGLTVSKSNKVISSCKYCNIITKNMLSHFTDKHPDKIKEQEDLAIDMFKSGYSCRSITLSEKTIFNSTTSIMRVIRKHLTPDEIETLRKTKIKNTLKKEYADGTYDWVNELNRNRNMTSEAKEKNSNGLKRVYQSGDRKAWNKGLTKSTDERVSDQSQSISQSMKDMFASGELEKKIGPESSNWNEDRENVAKRYRLGIGFDSEERGLIKKRAGYKCEKCGTAQEELEENGLTLECDHIIPIVKNGANDWQTNAQALCPACHRTKTTEDLRKEDNEIEITQGELSDTKETTSL